MDQDKKPNGALVGLTIIVIILIIGGIYIWQSKVKESFMEKKTTNPSMIAPGDETTDDGAELNSLDAELDSTNADAGVDLETVQ